MKKILLCALMAPFLTSFAQGNNSAEIDRKTNKAQRIPNKFSGLWVYSSNEDDKKSVCKSRKITGEEVDDTYLVLINPKNNTMKLDGTWLSEISHFNSVSISADGDTISGRETTTVLMSEGLKRGDEFAPPSETSTYKFVIRNGKLYFNEELRPSENPSFAFSRCQ